MGGALGAGSYFAENSRYSDAYSRMQPHAQWAGGHPAGAHPGVYYPARVNAPPPHTQQAVQDLQAAIQIPHGALRAPQR